MQWARGRTCTWPCLQVWLRLQRPRQLICGVVRRLQCQQLRRRRRRRVAVRPGGQAALLLLAPAATPCRQHRRARSRGRLCAVVVAVGAAAPHLSDEAVKGHLHVAGDAEERHAGPVLLLGVVRLDRDLVILILLIPLMAAANREKLDGAGGKGAGGRGRRAPEAGKTRALETSVHAATQHAGCGASPGRRQAGSAAGRKNV